MARTHYDVLMISPRADPELISVVYRHLAKRYHPDREPSARAAKRMIELNEAYAVLSVPQDRAAYDVRAGLRPAKTPAVTPGDDRPARRGGANTASATEDGPYGEAGSPPASPRAEGRLLTFGRYRGWALNQVARHDRDYIEWLSRTTMGRNYKRELDELLRRAP